MTNLAFAIIAIAVAALALQVWTTTRVWRSEWFSRANKLAQAKLVWLLPLIGALVVLCAHHEIAKEDGQAKQQQSWFDSST